MKTCIDCGKDCTGKYYARNRCKKCYNRLPFRKEKTREYLKQPEVKKKRRIWTREYKRKHREKSRLYDRRYHQKRKEKKLIQQAKEDLVRLLFKRNITDAERKTFFKKIKEMDPILYSKLMQLEW